MKEEKEDLFLKYLREDLKLYVRQSDCCEGIVELRKEIEKINNIINKAIEYIETHQLNFKKGTTTFGSERLSMEERKLIDILRGVDKE